MPAPTGPYDEQQRRRLLIAVATACLVVGAIVGAAAGSGSRNATRTVTHAQQVAHTVTATVPVVHVKTVTRVRHVVRVRTTTVTVASSAAPGGGSSGSSEGVGSTSHAGDAAFCASHTCIGDFEGEDGSIVECADGTYSHAGGLSGACSHHGGER